MSPSRYSPSMGSPVARHNFNNQKFEAQFRINEVPQASRNNKFTFRDVMVNLYKENGGNDSDY